MYVTELKIYMRLSKRTKAQNLNKIEMNICATRANFPFCLIRTGKEWEPKMCHPF